jgi:hypothetical protein
MVDQSPPGSQLLAGVWAAVKGVNQVGGFNYKLKLD